MTICSKMYEALDKRLEEQRILRSSPDYKPKEDEEGKEIDAIDEIGKELCDAVVDPRGKAIRLIKVHKGEKFLKDNAKWLGYHEEFIGASKKFDAQKEKEQSIRDDARSNGLRVDTPIYGMDSGATIQSMHDEFEPDEIVYEHSEEDNSCSLNACLQKPHNETTTISVVISKKAMSALQMLTEKQQKTQSEVINGLLECSIIEKVNKK